MYYSQSLLSLNKLEEFLSQRYIPNTEQKWEKNINYYSKFINYPGVENIAIWKWILKGKPLDQLENKFYCDSV